MSNNDQVIIGLQIGGVVNPNHRVGMHIPMPTQAGVGVIVDVNEQKINAKIKEIINTLPEDDLNTKDIRIIANKALQDSNKTSKLEKIKSLLTMGSGIATISKFIYELGVLVKDN